MLWLDSIGVWIAQQVVKYLLGIAVLEVQKWKDQVELDKERGETNNANSKAYEEAVDRATRRQAALNLLNRVRQP